ncbi:MAG: phage tail protein [Desulforhopalus sp.]
MSSAITTLGQTRINQLRGAEEPLIIDRMVLADIPGLDASVEVDRSQQMPPVEQIVYTATIEDINKGYVDPDQVVYSIILGTDLGPFNFNWIGLVEAETDIVIAVSTFLKTLKRKTDVSLNSTGNTITRNFMIQFVDAQNLTDINIAAETWQFDYQAEFSAHESLLVNTAGVGVGPRHVSSAQSKVWQDHAEDPHNFALVNGNENEVFKAALGTGPSDVVIQSQIATTSNAGILVLASGTQVREGSSSFSAVTPTALASFLKSHSANGYQTFPGGLILQWGKVNVASANTTQTFSFPLSFPGACLVLVGSSNLITGVDGAESFGAFSAISSSEFSVRNYYNHSDMIFGWIAIGF